jgi:hypothetical protein
MSGGIFDGPSALGIMPMLDMSAIVPAPANSAPADSKPIAFKSPVISRPIIKHVFSKPVGKSTKAGTVVQAFQPNRMNLRSFNIPKAVEEVKEQTKEIEKKVKEGKSPKIGTEQTDEQEIKATPPEGLETAKTEIPWATYSLAAAIALAAGVGFYFIIRKPR